MEVNTYWLINNQVFYGDTLMYDFGNYGIYTVALVSQTACDIDTNSQTITLLTAPIADFQANLLDPCSFLVEVVDQSQGSPNSITFDFGTGHTDTLPTSIYQYSTSGTHTIYLIVCNAIGCDTTTQTISIPDLPQADFLVSDTAYALSPTQFTDNSSSNVISWNWNFGNSQTSTLPSPQITFDTLYGNRTIELIVTTIDGCQDTITKDIYITFPVSTHPINSTSAIRIFPNPTQTYITIHIDNLILQNRQYPIELFISNLKGQLIRKEQLLYPQQQIDVSDLTAGTYVVQCVRGKRLLYSEKVVVVE